MIQIFGTKKCNDTKKAERFFKERRINYQFIDMKEKGMSKGEFNSVAHAVGGIDKLINENCKDKDMLVLIEHMSGDDRLEKILENQQIIKTPVTRNGKTATIGYSLMHGRIGNEKDHNTYDIPDIWMYPCGMCECERHSKYE